MSCITEILKLKGDKKALVPDGNWIAVEGGGQYKGYEYLIVLNTLGHRCGYVAIPDEHPYSKTPLEDREFNGREWKHYDYNTLEIECHGGLTFMSPTHGLKDLLPIACNDMWIGFDCGHSWDKSDIEATREYYGEEHVKKHQTFFDATSFDPTEHIKSYAYAESECKSIIEQLMVAA